MKTVVKTSVLSCRSPADPGALCRAEGGWQHSLLGPYAVAGLAARALRAPRHHRHNARSAAHDRRQPPVLQGQYHTKGTS